MKIISISGLDGSGKSTQIEMLKAYLESQGKKVFYFHAVQFSIANRRKIQNTRYKIQNTKSVTTANWLQIQLRKVALLIDTIRFKSFKNKLEKQGFDYIVSDRYFYDSIINIAYLSLGCHPELDSGSTQIPDQVRNDKYYNKIPRPDFAFYLNATPENIMSRDRVPDQGLEYLKKKKKLLDKFAEEKNLIILNGNKPVTEINSKILSEIK